MLTLRKEFDKRAAAISKRARKKGKERGHILETEGRAIDTEDAEYTEKKGGETMKKKKESFRNRLGRKS